MDVPEMADRFSELAYLEREAARAYSEAVRTADADADVEALERARLRHDEHGEALGRLLDALAERPGAPTDELRALMSEHVESVMLADGNDESLAVLRAVEQTAGLEYAETLRLEMPPEVRALIERQHDEDREALRHLEEALTAAQA